MTRAGALRYTAFGVDDALAIRPASEVPADAVLVGWQCGYEPMFVAVWSYLGVQIDVADAEDLARDALIERGWFAGDPTPADYFITQ